MVKIGNNVREAGWSACNRAFLGIGAVGGLPGFPLWDLAQLSGAPTAPEPLASMHFYAPSLWVASLATVAIELAQCRMQQRYTFCNHT